MYPGPKQPDDRIVALTFTNMLRCVRIDARAFPLLFSPARSVELLPGPHTVAVCYENMSRGEVGKMLSRSEPMEVSFIGQEGHRYEARSVPCVTVGGKTFSEKYFQWAVTVRQKVPDQAERGRLLPFGEVPDSALPLAMTRAQVVPFIYDLTTDEWAPDPDQKRSVQRDLMMSLLRVQDAFVDNMSKEPLGSGRETAVPAKPAAAAGQKDRTIVRDVSEVFRVNTNLLARYAVKQGDRSKGSRVTGRLVHAASGQAVTNMLLCLMTIVDGGSRVTSLPDDVMTTTGKDGSFCFENVRPNQPPSYYLVASSPRVLNIDKTPLYVSVPGNSVVDMGVIRVITVMRAGGSPGTVPASALVTRLTDSRSVW
jgi:hypothetical protein